MDLPLIASPHDLQSPRLGAASDPFRVPERDRERVFRSRGGPDEADRGARDRDRGDVSRQLSWTAGSRELSKAEEARGDLDRGRRGVCIAGSMRGSYPCPRGCDRPPEAKGFSKRGRGSVGLREPLIGLNSSMDDWRSLIRLSNFERSDGFRPALELTERAGLERELGWLDRPWL